MTKVVLINTATALSLLRLVAYVSDHQARLCSTPGVKMVQPKRRALMAPCSVIARRLLMGDVRTDIHLGFCHDVDSDQRLVLLGVGLFDRFVGVRALTTCTMMEIS